MRSTAIFATCVILATIAIANCQNHGERAAEIVESLVGRFQESQVPIAAETAKQLILMTSSNEFKEFVNMLDEDLGQLVRAYHKFVVASIDGFCELKDNPDATMKDVRNMLEGITFE